MQSELGWCAPEILVRNEIRKKWDHTGSRWLGRQSGLGAAIGIDMLAKTYPDMPPRKNIPVESSLKYWDAVPAEWDARYTSIGGTRSDELVANDDGKNSR